MHEYGAVGHGAVLRATKEQGDQRMTVPDDYKGLDGRGWICDSCGEPIWQAIDGWVQWMSGRDDGKRTARDLQLVHHLPASPRVPDPKPSSALELRAYAPGCQFDEQVEFAKDKMIVSDLPLTYFLGADGLMELLMMLHENFLPQEVVIEMTKRLHIPGYEHARFHFEKAVAQGVFESNRPEGFYRVGEIANVNEWADENNE